MSGIASYGIYLPRHRLPLSVLSGSARQGGPERTLAWADEDSITLGLEAARRALAGRDRSAVDLLLFATTTHAYSEKQGAALLATALGLEKSVRTADVGNSLRSGASALVAALDAIEAGRAREALVIIADVRQGAPGSDLERSGGDAAVAFVVTGTGGRADFIGTTSATEELVDVWRRSGDRFTHSWEDRFTSTYGQVNPLVDAGRHLAARYADQSHTNWIWALSAASARTLASVSRSLQLKPEMIQDGLFGSVGFSGAAHAPLLLAAALDRAVTGDHVAMVAHGDGAEALLFRVSAPAGQPALQPALDARVPVASPAAYRKARGLDLTEYEPADDPGISATVHFRERAENLRLQGQRCQCGEPQFPKGRVCIRCGTRDSFIAEDFAERGGRIVTYTLDAFFPSPNPPTAVGIVQVDNGPRLYLQIADIPAGQIDIGLPVYFAFRRIHEAGRRPNYFWKAVPGKADQ